MYIPLDIHKNRIMASSTVFTSNRSQAVRLPKPQGKRWDDLFQSGPRASQDFMVERQQLPTEEREPL
jgi:antitoxin VapB